jgi:hypothetical protein
MDDLADSGIEATVLDAVGTLTRRPAETMRSSSLGSVQPQETSGRSPSASSLPTSP